MSIFKMESSSSNSQIKPLWPTFWHNNTSQGPILWDDCPEICPRQNSSTDPKEKSHQPRNAEYADKQSSFYLDIEAKTELTKVYTTNFKQSKDQLHETIQATFMQKKNDN